MQQSLFSVSYAGYWGQHTLDLPSFIKRAAELGYDSVMIAGKRPHFSPLDMTEDRLAALRSALKSHNIACSVVAGYTDLSPTTAVEIPYLEMQISYVESLAKLAACLGAPIVRVFTAYETNDHNSTSLWQDVVRSLQEMCDRAAAHNVTLAVQNHHDVGVHTDALLELLSDIDRANCRLGFDAWSPALRDEDLYDVAKRMAPHTAITTNADYVRFPRYRYVPSLVNYTAVEPPMVRAVKFGDGFIDYEAFFRGLRDGGFDGIASYEMCSPVRGGGHIENLDAYAAEYLHWMRNQELA